jgi:RNA polymerase sigma factor (sigma-70 family)
MVQEAKQQARGSKARQAQTGSLLGAYAGSFPSCRRLSKEDEAALTRAAAAGDRRALEGLIAANFPLIVKTALAFRRTGLPLEDLLGEACMGLLEAVSRFDPDRGFRFMTYAVWWVRRALVRAVSTQSRNVRIPRHRAAERDAAPWPRELSLADETDGESAWSLEDLLEADDEPLDELVQRDEESRAVHDALDGLPERQRYVLEQRFGLVTDETRTLKDVAGDLGVTKERVRQIEGQALGKLERALRSSLSLA